MQPTKGSSINESAGTFRIRCTWLSFFVITIGPEYKQDTLSHHFIQSSRKYFGGSHQLYLDRKQLVTTTTSDSLQPPKPKWISSGRPGTNGPLTLAATPSHVWPKRNHVQSNHYSLNETHSLHFFLLMLTAKKLKCSTDWTQVRCAGESGVSDWVESETPDSPSSQSQRRQIEIEMNFFLKKTVIFPGVSAALELKITRFSRRKKLLSFTTDLQHADMGKCIIAANAPISVLAEMGRRSSDWLANGVACGKLAAPVPRLRPKSRKRGSLGAKWLERYSAVVRSSLVK